MARSPFPPPRKRVTRECYSRRKRKFPEEDSSHKQYTKPIRTGRHSTVRQHYVGPSTQCRSEEQRCISVTTREDIQRPDLEQHDPKKRKGAKRPNATIFHDRQPTFTIMTPEQPICTVS